MDKLSLKILKYIAFQEDNVPAKSIIDLFGPTAQKSLDFLLKECFVKSKETILGIGADMKPVFAPIGIYSITSKGLAFLEERPGVLYDKWSTRFFAIWGAITGTAALVLELVLHFL